MDEISWEEIEPDPVYEFDAPRYFDFSLGESDSEFRDADRWFDTAESCSPSPYVVKMNWRHVEMAYTSMTPKDGENMCSVHNASDINVSIEAAELDNNQRELCSQKDMTPNIPKFKTKTFEKYRNSTLMRPTASYLAKQNHRQEVYSCLCHGRSQKPVVKTGKSSPNPSLFEIQSSKRQKLESGYLSKVPQLNYHTLLHKAAKKVDINSSCARPKVTIPREPILETARRAQRHRLASSIASKQEISTSDYKFKAHPLDKKEFKFHGDKRLRHNLPIESFSKLSLTSSSQPDTVSEATQQRTKGLKEFGPSSLGQEIGKRNGIKEKQQKIV